MEERILLFTEVDARQAIRSYVADKARALGVRVTFIAPDGNVIADSEEDPAFMDNHSDRPEIREAMEGRDNSHLRFSKTLQSNILYYAHRVHRDDRIIGVLRLSKLTTVVDAMIDGLKLKCIIIVTHNLAQAGRISDDTSFMYLGELVETGPTGSVFTNPKHEQTERFLTGKMG